MDRTHQAPLRSGALTLLLTVTALCLSVLAVLALATARADLALAQKGAGRLTQVTQADNAGQQWLAGLDQALRTGGDLPEGARLENGVVTGRLACGDAGVLHLAVRLQGEGWRVTRWQLERPWQPEERLDVWAGPDQ